MHTTNRFLLLIQSLALGYLISSPIILLGKENNNNSSTYHHNSEKKIKNRSHKFSDALNAVGMWFMITSVFWTCKHFFWMEFQEIGREDVYAFILGYILTELADSLNSKTENEIQITPEPSEQ